MRGALDVHRELLSRGVPHEVVRLPAPVVTADDLPRVLGVDPAQCVAARVYVTDLGPAVIAVHAGVVPDPAAALEALGARTLRPATADEANSATDYAAGLVSPVALPAGVRLLADAALSGSDVLYCPVGESGVALGIRSHDLLTATAAQVAGLSALPLPAHADTPWGGGARVIELDVRGPARRTPGRSVG